MGIVKSQSQNCAYFQFWQSSLLYQIGENMIKLSQIESKKLTEMRDPLFVISTALKIIKHQSEDKKITPEIERIETALSRIEKIMQ